MGTQNYFWHFIFSVFLCTKNVTALGETTSTQIEANTKTEAAPMSPTWEGSSQKVPARSEETSPTIPTPSPGTTATSMDTASGTAASLSLQRSSAATSLSSSSSSSPVGFTAATTTPQQSSTSENTEAGLAAPSHPSMALASSASSSTPAATGTGSGTVSTYAQTDGSAPSTPSSMPSASTSSTSLVSETTDASLSSTQTGSTKMHAVQLTSKPIMQGQATTEVKATSYTPESPLAAMATTFDANPDTALPSKAETPNTNEGSGLTTDPNTKMTRSLPATLLVTPSTPPVMEGETRTEVALTTPAGEGSSQKVPARSEETNATIPTPSPGTTATSMDTASGTAASLSLQRSSAATSLSSSSSSPVGFTAATTTPQQSSTSENTEAGLAATSHPSMALASSASSSTPAVMGIGSGTPSTNALTHGPAPSSAAASHPSFSSPDGFTAATTTLQQSSTSGGTTKESLATTSHLSRALVSSAPSSTPAIMVQMTTVAPKSAMARFTRSTANPIFTTTFASGPCMPVSIKVQNVTGDAIQFSWTSGRRGSLHTISLMDGNQEINKTTTKETKTVFEHLLPGHVYRISVEAQSCAGESRTSVSVRTDSVSCFNRTEFCLPQNTACSDLKDTVCSYYQAFACSVLLKGQTFNHTLYDSESEDYKTMSERIRTEVVREMRIRLKDDQFSIIMLGFRPGSVIADFISLLQTQDSIGVNVMQAHLSQILKSKFGDQTEVTIQSSSAQSSTEICSTWKVAVIVLGVLLGVALVLIFLITLYYIYMKKRSDAYLVEPKGLLGNFVYKHI